MMWAACGLLTVVGIGNAMICGAEIMDGQEAAAKLAGAVSAFCIALAIYVGRISP